MIFENTPLKMTLQFMTVCLIFSFQAPVSNAIPFMYYRADLACKIDGEWQNCQEKQICENNYEFKFINKHGMESISMDYGLVCEKRLDEATILSLGFFGGLAAFFVAIFFEIPKCQKTNVLFLILLTEGLLLNSLVFIRGSIMWVTFVIFQWNFFFSYFYSQVFAYSNDMYTPAIKERTVGIVNIMWTGGALIFAFFSQFTGNWIHHTAYFGGLTIWVLSIFFFLFRSPPAENNDLKESLLQSAKPKKSDQQEAEEHQKNFVEDLIEKFKLVRENNKYMTNSIIVIVAWSIFQVSYCTPFIAFNSLGGNIQQNVFISIICDFVGSFIAYYLLRRFDPIRLLLNNLLIIGFLQAITFFVPSTSYVLQMIPILVTKLSTRIGFPTVITLLPFILPYQFNQLVFNLGNISSIIFTTFLPFYKYFMESQGINIFCGVGVVTLLFLLFAVRVKTLEDEIPEMKAVRLSRDFKRVSNFAPMKRNSDIIIEQLLRKSSMMTDKAAAMSIDKQSVMQERKYELLLKGKSLQAIPEL